MSFVLFTVPVDAVLFTKTLIGVLIFTWQAGILLRGNRPVCGVLAELGGGGRVGGQQGGLLPQQTLSHPPQVCVLSTAVIRIRLDPHPILHKFLLFP